MMELEHEANLLVAESGQSGVVQFTDLSAIDDELSTVCLVQCADDVEEGGLARSRGTDDANDFFLVDMQVNAF